MLDHAHDRFLFVKDGEMHFGCINPFCMHGNFGLPAHYKLPMDIPAMTLKLLSHKDRKVTFEVTLKSDASKFKSGTTTTLTADDNLEACKAKFDEVFGSSEKEEKRQYPRFV